MVTFPITITITITINTYPMAEITTGRGRFWSLARFPSRRIAKWSIYTTLSVIFLLLSFLQVMNMKMAISLSLYIYIYIYVYVCI